MAVSEHDTKTNNLAYYRECYMLAVSSSGLVSSHFLHLFECFQNLVHVFWMEQLHVLREPEQTENDERRGRGRESVEDE